MRIATKQFLVLALVLAAPAAAQGEIAPTPDGLALEVLGKGSAQLEAQGYEITAYLARSMPAKESDLPAINALRARLEALTSPARETCSQSVKTGFVGNGFITTAEPASSDVEANDVTAAAADEAEASFDGDALSFWASTYNVTFNGQFADRADLEEALSILEGAELRPMMVSGLVFDCEEARRRASVDALRDAHKKAEGIAADLGLEVTAMTHAKIGTSDQDVTYYMPVQQVAGQQNTVSYAITARVTFHLTSQ